MEFSLERVDPGKRVVLERLLQFELYELDMEPGSDGVIDWGESLDKFFRDPGCIPLFIAADETTLGFALIKTNRTLKGPDGCTDTVMNLLAEFYVLRPWRRKGIGTTAARMVFRAYPGAWVVTTWPNGPQVAFWRHVMNHIPETDFQEYRPGEHEGFPGQFVWVVRATR